MTGSEGPEGVQTRRVALEVLARVEDDGAYANLALGAVLDRCGLDRRDRALVTDLVYGTIRYRRSVGHLVKRFLADDPPAPAARALHLGAYQLSRRPDIPGYAAVAATVGATPKRFRGLVNAVLRKVSQAPVDHPDEATELSYPDWIVSLLIEDLGHDRAVAALGSMNEPAMVHRRSDGYVQDPASQYVVAELLDALEDPGRARVADLCAAPGGKATALAAGGARTVVAADRRAARMGLTAKNVYRMGADPVVLLIADALRPALRPASFDAVLLDAPCSGLGVLRRRADARWRVDAQAPARLAVLQRAMLDAALELVSPGGVLVYSVCTLTSVETIGVAEDLGAQHRELVALDPPGDPWVPWGTGALLLPQTEGTDGMALFRWRTAAT